VLYVRSRACPARIYAHHPRRARLSDRRGIAVLLLSSSDWWYQDPQRECSCSLGMVQRYQKRISGPLIDRLAGESGRRCSAVWSG